MNIRVKFLVLFSFATLPTTVAQNECSEYEEIDGLVIMEAENTSSDYTNFWELKTDVADYKGSGHLEFLQNETRGGNPRGPLSYTFRINAAGYYRILLRARKRIAEDDDQDKSNDCYIRVEGDFSASPNANDEDYGAAKLEILETDTKIYGGNIDSWGKAFTLDLGAAGKRVPIYNFKAGETYTFTMSGRSKQYNVDRIIFYKVGTYGLNQEDIDRYDATPETTCDYNLAIRNNVINNKNAVQLLINPIIANTLLLKQSNQNKLLIINLQGKILKEIIPTSEYMTIDIAELPAGIYLLKSEKAVQRFLVE